MQKHISIFITPLPTFANCGSVHQIGERLWLFQNFCSRPCQAQRWSSLIATKTMSGLILPGPAYQTRNGRWLQTGPRHPYLIVHVLGVAIWSGSTTGLGREMQSTRWCHSDQPGKCLQQLCYLCFHPMKWSLPMSCYKCFQFSLNMWLQKDRFTFRIQWLHLVNNIERKRSDVSWSLGSNTGIIPQETLCSECSWKSTRPLGKTWSAWHVQGGEGGICTHWESSPRKGMMIHHYHPLTMTHIFEVVQTAKLLLLR